MSSQKCTDKDSTDMIDMPQKPENDGNLPEWAGGNGGTAISRQSLAMIKSAVVNGWDIPDKWKQALPSLCLKMALDDSRGDRERLRAIEILRAMQRDNLDAAQALDKVERLDQGQATERVELGQITWNPER